MDTIHLLELMHNTYGLIIVLKDMIWSFDDVSKDNQRKFSGILALIETIEQNSYNIKVELESAVTIQGKRPYNL